MKHTFQKGFTLIELMITVAIIGILASVALPSYQNYTIRAQVSEAFSLAGGVQLAMSEYYLNNGSLAGITSLASLGISTSPTGKYVSSVTAAASVITLTFGGSAANSKISGKTITLTGVDTASTGTLKWQCAGSVVTANAAYVPASCTTVTN